MEYYLEIIVAAWPLIIIMAVIIGFVLNHMAKSEDEFESLYEHYDMDDINDKKEE